MAVDQGKWSATQLAPYKRIGLRISIAIGMSRRNWEREESVEIEAIMDRHFRIPRCDDTRAVAHCREPMHIILDGECNTVQHRRETVVEQSYYLIANIHSIIQIRSDANSLWSETAQHMQ